MFAVDASAALFWLALAGMALATAIAALALWRLRALRKDLARAQSAAAATASAALGLAEGYEALLDRRVAAQEVNDNLPGGYLYQVVQRRDGSYIGHTYLSRGVEALFGLTREQIMADPALLHDTILPEDRPLVDAADRESARELRTFEVEARRRLADGRVGWFQIRSVPQLLADGLVLWDGVCLDITARKEAELALTRARDEAQAWARASGAFVASMSHEIRTPLNAVVGMAGLLLSTPLTAEQRVFADTIATGGQALLEVVSNILDISRLEAGQVLLELQPLALRPFLRQTLDLVAQPAREKGVALHLDVCEGVPAAIFADSGRLRQALLNLLANAVKFTQAGEVRLRAWAEPAEAGRVHICFAVQDTGIGIAPGRLAQIFERFVQAEIATARRFGGAGLGLAICRQLVSLMGGEIDVVSELAVGSTFTLRIAFHLAPGWVAPPAEEVGGEPGRLHVLIVEDEPINQVVTRHMVERLGHAATVVGDGRAAVAAVQAAAYDVVLMDVLLPELDGLAAARQIRALGARIAQPHLIGLTAAALPGDRERVLAAGMNDYLSKPVALAALRRSLDLAPALGGAVEASPALLDVAALASVIRPLEHAAGGGAGIAARLFAEALPPLLDAIDAAVAGGDVAAWRAGAHRLCGGCLQLGAVAMVRLARALERAEDGQAASALAGQLRACFAETHAALLEFARGPAAIER